MKEDLIAGTQGINSNNFNSEDFIKVPRIPLHSLQSSQYNFLGTLDKGDISRGGSPGGTQRRHGLCSSTRTVKHHIPRFSIATGEGNGCD